MLRLPHFLGLPSEDVQSVVTSVGLDRWCQLAGKRLLLTGGTGFIGKWLLASVLDALQTFDLQVEIVVVSRKPSVFLAEYPGLELNANVIWVERDIRDLGVGEIASCDFSIHAATDVVATSSSSEVFDTCVRGTQRVLDLVDDGRGGGRVLLLSSGAVYGPSTPSISQFSEDWEGAPDPLLTSSAYGEGKRASELICAIAAAERPGLTCAIARCFAFVGPHLPLDKHFAIGNFIRAAMHGDDIIIKGDGTPMRSYLYASDLAHWLWVLLFDAPNGRAYNVGGDLCLSIGALAERVNFILGGKGAVNILTPPKPGVPPLMYIPALERIRNEFGLSPVVDLDEAIRRTAKWAADFERY